MSKSGKYKKKKQQRPSQPLPSPQKGTIAYRDNLIPRKGLRVFLPFLFFILFVASVFLFVQGWSENARQRRGEDSLGTMRQMVQQNSDRWNLSYSGGYRLVTMEGGKAAWSRFNSLPKSLTMDWQDMAFLRLDAKEEEERPGTVKINFPNLTYRPAEIYSRSIIAAFLPQQGTRVILFDSGEEKLIFDVLEAYENKIIGILGLR